MATNENMSPDQRLTWLRDHGVQIETPEERKAKMVAEAMKEPDLQNVDFENIAYVIVPADKSKPIQQLSVKGGIGDQLVEHLKFAFCGNSHKVDVSLLQGPHLVGSAEAPVNVSEKTLKEVASKGNVEVFPLVHATQSNKFTGINIYLDEAGMLKRLPLNTRASDYAARAGFNPPPQFYGDVFLGRVQAKPVLRNLPFEVGQDTALDAPWLQSAMTTNLEYQMELNQLTGQANRQQPAPVGHEEEKTEEGFSWKQSEEELEVFVALEDGIVSKQIQVKFLRQKLSIEIAKKKVLSLNLFYHIDVDSGTWTIEKSSAGTRKLAVSMEKTDSAFWPRIKQ